MISPVPATRARSHTVPILVRLPAEYRFFEPAVRLDGKPVSLSGIVRRRWWEGKGADFIATLPTDSLTPGWHELQFRFSSPDFDPVAGAASTQSEVLEISTRFEFAPRDCQLVVKVEDGDGQPRHARVGVMSLKGGPLHVGDKNHRQVDPSKRDKRRNSFFAIDGIGFTRLTPGRFELIVSGGVRDDVVVREVDLERTCDQTVAVTLRRLIETPQEVTADLHVHTGWSSDAFISDHPRFRGLAAADLDVAVFTDHNRVRDPRSALELLGLTDAFVPISGTERHIGSYKRNFGHANIFPLAENTRLGNPGAVDIGQAVAGWRKLLPVRGFSGKTLLQLNHPRGIQFWPMNKHIAKAHAVFTDLGLDTSRPLGQQDDPRLMAKDAATGHSLLDIDAIEILNRFSIQAWRRTRLDWFGLMNQGWFPTGTGNSDSHSVELERVGFPVNLVTMPDPLRFKVDAFVDSIRAGRVRVSSGPLVDLRVGTDSPSTGDVAGPGERISGPVDQVWVEVRVRAAPWVPVPEVRLVVDGEVVRRVRLPEERAGPGAPLERGTFRWQLPIEGDTWVLAEAGWPLDDDSRPDSGVYPEVARGHVPIGFTNPVRIDADGDRRWTPLLDPEVFVPSSVW